MVVVNPSRMPQQARGRWWHTLGGASVLDTIVDGSYQDRSEEPLDWDHCGGAGRVHRRTQGEDLGTEGGPLGPGPRHLSPRGEWSKEASPLF